MVLLEQRKQIGIAVEAVEGTAETITSSDLVTVLNPSATINLNNIRRPVLRGTFTKLVSGTGIRDATITFEQEFASPFDTTPATSAPIGATLRACGFRETLVYAVRIRNNTTAANGFSGARVVVGDELVADSTGARIRVVATNTQDNFLDFLAGGDKNTHGDILFYEVLDAGTGGAGGISTADAELVADNTNLLAATVSHGGGTPELQMNVTQTGTLVGTAWLPSSEQTLTLTVASAAGNWNVGDTILQSLDGAPNNLEIAYGTIVALDDATTPTAIEVIPLQGSGHSFDAGASNLAIVNNDDTGTATLSAVTPAQTPSLTVKLFEDGITKTFTGCRGTCTMSFPTGGFPVLQVELQGAVGTIQDEVNLSAGGTLQGEVPTFLGTEFRVDRDWLPCQSTMTIDMGQNLVRRTCQNAASGLEGFIITDRVPTLTMDPEVVKEVVADNYSRAINATAFPIQLRFGNFTSGTLLDAWLISADQCQFEALNTGDRDGISTYDATLQLNGYSTVNDSEIAIVNYSQTLVGTVAANPA